MMIAAVMPKETIATGAGDATTAFVKRDGARPELVRSGVNVSGANAATMLRFIYLRHLLFMDMVTVGLPASALDCGGTPAK